MFIIIEIGLGDYLIEPPLKVYFSKILFIITFFCVKLDIINTRRQTKMSNNNKQQERAELHKTIWGIANDLRGSIDGWDFKQYVLGMLFYRYISENLTNYINKDEREYGNLDFDYKELSDEEAESIRDDIVKTKGFFILPSELFVNIKKNAKGHVNNSSQFHFY